MGMPSITPRISQEEEHGLIKHDLRVTVIINAILLAILLGLFFADRTSGTIGTTLQKFLAKMF
jgi:hypothetical protein